MIHTISEHRIAFQLETTNIKNEERRPARKMTKCLLPIIYSCNETKIQDFIKYVVSSVPSDSFTALEFLQIVMILLTKCFEYCKESSTNILADPCIVSSMC